MEGKASARESSVASNLSFFFVAFLSLFLVLVEHDFSMRETNIAWRAMRCERFVAGRDLVPAMPAGPVDAAEVEVEGRDALVRIVARPCTAVS